MLVQTRRRFSTRMFTIYTQTGHAHHVPILFKEIFILQLRYQILEWRQKKNNLIIIIIVNFSSYLVSLLEYFLFIFVCKYHRWTFQVVCFFRLLVVINYNQWQVWSVMPYLTFTGLGRKSVNITNTFKHDKTETKNFTALYHYLKKNCKVYTMHFHRHISRAVTTHSNQ